MSLLILRKGRADVVVLANRTPAQLTAVVTPSTGAAQRVTIDSGEALPVFLDGRASVDFASRGRPKRYQLDANCAYYFGRATDGGNDLQMIGLGEDEAATAGRTLPISLSTAPPVAVIPVKILVDEEEAARQIQWERRLRARIEAASAILERHCAVRLEVTAVGVWNSDNANNDFFAALGEFERKARPFPAQLAIGFTSQFTSVVGRTHMAGTRGPLHSHILVREGSPQIGEPERLEFLVHELGHFLGASHSPEPGSVMRPVLGDKRAGRSGFRIRFDPVNTLVMALVGEEMRRNNVKKITDLSADGKRRLGQIYTELSRAFPDDPASKHFIQIMQSSSAMPLAAGTKRVLQEIVRAALANKALPAAETGGTNTAGKQQRREGDGLTQYYVRQAARAAESLPPEVGPTALLLALGIGLDDSDVLRKLSSTGGMVVSVETPQEREIRLSLLGNPTMLGRRDLAQHFFVSAHLAATLGDAAADTAGLAKELLDANGGSGFSFADLAADRAGRRFASGVRSKQLSLAMLSQSFLVPAFIPSIKDLPEGLTAADLAQQFGDKDDDRFLKQVLEIDQRILNLPPYRQAEAVLGR
jgi:hypothetical protein